MSLVTIAFGPSAAARLQPLGLKIFSARGDLSLDADSRFEAPGSTQPSLAPGSLVQVGAFASLAGGGTMGNVRIGRYVSIAAGVSIGMHNHPTDWLSTSRLAYYPQIHDWHTFCGDGGPAVTSELRRPFDGACPVTEIGNDVWIGQGVFIRSGVRIGDGAVIGARSVVVKDVEPYTVVAGTPAKPLRRRFPDAVVERLLEMRWWRYSLYDMAGVPFEDVPAALDAIAERVARGDLKEFRPPVYTAADLAALFAPVTGTAAPA